MEGKECVEIVVSPTEDTIIKLVSDLEYAKLQSKIDDCQSECIELKKINTRISQKWKI